MAKLGIQSFSKQTNTLFQELFIGKTHRVLIRTLLFAASKQKRLKYSHPRSRLSL